MQAERKIRGEKKFWSCGTWRTSGRRVKHGIRVKMNYVRERIALDEMSLERRMKAVAGICVEAVANIVPRLRRLILRWGASRAELAIL
jgi:hypothetical protein